MFNIEKNKKSKELKNLYSSSVEELKSFVDILALLKEFNVESIKELIKTHPSEAYINGIINNYNYNELLSDEECTELANNYFKNELDIIDELIEDIKEHDGDYEIIKLLLAGIVNYCESHQQ